MYYIRHKKSSSKLVNEAMHVPDTDNITKLTDFIMSSFLQGIKRDKMRNYEHPSMNFIHKLWDNINYCKEWLSNKTQIRFVEDRYGREDNEAKCDNSNSTLDSQDKIQDAIITVYMPKDILQKNDEELKKYIDNTADAVQHELTHVYSAWMELIDEKNGSSINKYSNKKHHKLNYWEAYSEMQEMMKAADNVEDPKDTSDIENWILQIKTCIGLMMYKCCEEERTSFRAGFYQQLTRAKKESDETGEDMKPITQFEPYKELIALYKNGLKAVKTIITSKKLSEAKEKAMKEILPVFESVFNISNATPLKIYNTFKKILEKEIYKYRKLYGVVKTYGKIPIEEK